MGRCSGPKTRVFLRIDEVPGLPLTHNKTLRIIRK
jgi:hypothetical protein